MTDSSEIKAYKAEIDKGYTSHQAINRVAAKGSNNPKKSPKRKGY